MDSTFQYCQRIRITLQALLLAMLLFGHTRAISQSCPCGNNINLFTNGDFESGELSPSNTEMSVWNVNCNEVFGCYAILSSASEVGGQFNGSPHGGTEFMFVDGQDASPGDTPQLVWEQTVDCLIPGQSYSFRFWLLGCSGFGDIFVLDASVAANGTTTILNPNTLINTMMPNSNAPLAWQQYSFNWVATASTATFSLDQISFNSSGFDFALDDIRLMGNSGALLEATAAASDISCNGEAGEITVTPLNGNSPYQVQLISPNGNIQMLNTTDFTHFTADQSGNYSISITDSGNCSTQLAVEVLQDDHLSSNLAVQNPTCSTAGVADFSPQNGVPPYTLYVNDQQQSSLNLPLETGDYIFHIEDSNGCFFDTSLTVTMDSTVFALFEFQNNENQIMVQNLSTGATNYTWYLNGIVISNDSVPSSAIELEVNSTLLLVATDLVSHCQDEYSINLIPLPDNFQIFVPNCVTADNDGLNDVLFVVADESQLRHFKCDIFNRWGQLVFTTDTTKKPWIVNSNEGAFYVPDGVYNYKIEYQLISDFQMYEKSGHINVIR